MDKALITQAVEYERRLNVLNHAHEEAVRVLNTYITRELFEKSQEELRAWRNSVDKTLALDQGRKGVLTGMISIVIAVAAVCVSFASYLASR